MIRRRLDGDRPEASSFLAFYGNNPTQSSDMSRIEPPHIWQVPNLSAAEEAGPNGPL